MWAPCGPSFLRLPPSAAHTTAQRQRRPAQGAGPAHVGHHHRTAARPLPLGRRRRQGHAPPRPCVRAGSTPLASLRVRAATGSRGADADGAELFSLQIRDARDRRRGRKLVVRLRRAGSGRVGGPAGEHHPGGARRVVHPGPRAATGRWRSCATPRADRSGRSRAICRRARRGREAAEALAAETGFELFFSRGIPDSADWRRSPSAKTRPLGFSAELGVCGAASGDDAGCCFPLVNFNYTFGR